MKNITLSIDDSILQAGREYAHSHNMSFVVLVRRLIEQTNDLDLIEQAIDISVISQVSFRDALIIAAAEKANCEFVFSEDLNTGQTYRGVTVVNPFDDEEF
jgi:predicted nucleic acid-binding protein